MISCASHRPVNILLRLFVPALALGAVLLLGERPSCPPDEALVVEMSASPDDPSGRAAPCPGLVRESAIVPAPALRLPPAAGARLTAAAAAPEARSLSPPFAA